MAEELVSEATEDPRSVDTYSAAEAARVLGVSERRVRQLVGTGRLQATGPSDGPLRLDQEQVHRERQLRRQSARASVRTLPPDPPAELDIEGLVERLIRQMLPLMLEPARRAEESALAMVHQERARLLEVETRLVEERVRRELAETRLAELEQRLVPVNPWAAPLKSLESPVEGSGGRSAPRGRLQWMLRRRSE
jgi:hypothetical protein